MPKNNESFNEELDGFLRARGFDNVQTKDTDGDDVPSPKEADQFIFQYKNNSRDYGNVVITTYGGKITVYYNHSVTKERGGKDTEWTNFLISLKDWALRNGQMGFKVQNLDKLGNDMKRRKQQKREEQLLESYYGTRHTSYNNMPKIKMIIKHSKTIEEGDQRYRYIDKIFLENEIGERVLIPTKKPSVGRAFARHLAEGGQYNDERWKHISEIEEDINSLSGFVRATRTKQFNEDVAQVISEAVQHYEKLRETIKRLQGTRGYNSYFESWQPTLMEQNAEQDLSSMFVSSKLDPRIEKALPVLNKLNIKVNEISEATEFEAWANSIAEGRSPVMDHKIKELAKLLSDSETLPVGADAMNVKGQLEELIDDDDHRDALFDELDELAYSDPDNDAIPTIVSFLQKHKDEEFYGDVLDSIGEKSDIPADADIASGPETASPAPATPAVPAATPPAPATGAAPFMPQPLAEKAKKPAQRNFVAKHAQRSGAGSHGKKGFQRHDKHKKKLGENNIEYHKFAEQYILTESQASEQAIKILKGIGFAAVKTAKGSKGVTDAISAFGQSVMNGLKYMAGLAVGVGVITHPKDMWNAGNFAWNLISDPAETGKILWNYAKSGINVWGDNKQAVADLRKIMGNTATSDVIFNLANLAVENALPIAGVVALLYGGKQFADYLKSHSANEPGKKTFSNMASTLGKDKQQDVAEVKGTLWRVHHSEATGRYHVIKGYNKDIKMFKNKMGAGDFNSKEAAQAKADELNKGVAEGSNEIDQQAHAIADKLTTGKNLEKLRGMAYDSTVYRALDRYFEKHNIPETIYNRVAGIVFQRINQQDGAEGYKEPTDAAGHAKMAAKIKRMLDDTLADRGDRHGNPDPERLTSAYEYHIQKAKEKSQGMAEDKIEEIDRRGFLRGLGASALAGAAGSAMSQSIDASQAFANMRKDDPRIQHNKDIDEMAQAIYAQIVALRGQPIDRRQQQMWMTIAREKASEKLAKYAPGRTATQSQSSSFPAQGSERRVSRNVNNFESQGVAEDQLDEFAPSSSGGKDDVLKTLASNWYHGDVASGDLTSDIQSQEQVERRLEKGVVCPDGVKRKLYIDYSDDYEGVTIYSDDDWSITYKQDDLSEPKTNESLSAIKRLSGLK